MLTAKLLVVTAIATVTVIIGDVSAGHAFEAPAAGLCGHLSLDRSALVLDVKFRCKLIEGKLICGKDVNNSDEHGDDKAEKQKKQKKSGNICEGGGSCPPGYVVLDKPNKYGACCEPKEGFPDKTSPAPAAQQCKYGMIGTWPNDCHCPSGTEFYGYQGCLQTCCGLPSKDPHYIKEYVQCNGDPAAARTLSVNLARTNGVAETDLNKITCERSKKP